MTTPPDNNERRLVYAALLAAKRGDHDALHQLLLGLDLGERDTLTTQLAVVAAHHLPLDERTLAAACLQAAARG